MSDLVAQALARCEPLFLTNDSQRIMRSSTTLCWTLAHVHDLTYDSISRQLRPLSVPEWDERETSQSAISERDRLRRSTHCSVR